MGISWKNSSGKKPSEKDFAKVEKEFGHKLPTGLKSVVMKNNGATPEPNFCGGDELDVNLDYLFDFKAGKFFEKKHSETFAGLCTLSLFPFICAIGGDFVCLDYRETEKADSAPVVFVESAELADYGAEIALGEDPSELDLPVMKVANDWKDFLSRITEGG